MIIMIFGREPALIMGVIQAIIALVVVFGLSLPQGAEAAILVLAAAVLSLVTRSQVTPVGKHRADGR